MSRVVVDTKVFNDSYVVNSSLDVIKLHMKTVAENSDYTDVEIHVTYRTIKGKVEKLPYEADTIIVISTGVAPNA